MSLLYSYPDVLCLGCVLFRVFIWLDILSATNQQEVNDEAAEHESSIYIVIQRVCFAITD